MYIGTCTVPMYNYINCTIPTYSTIYMLCRYGTVPCGTIPNNVGTVRYGVDPSTKEKHNVSGNWLLPPFLPPGERWKFHSSPTLPWSAVQRWPKSQQVPSNHLLLSPPVNTVTCFQMLLYSVFHVFDKIAKFGKNSFFMV